MWQSPRSATFLQMSPTSTSAPLIEVDDLRVTYPERDSRGPVEAVRGLSFHVNPGEVYGLLGHNGAGKSTTVEVLEGHRRASSGTVRVLGFDPAKGSAELLDQIGIVLQTSAIEKQLTVREVLNIYGSVYSDPADPDSLIELVGLTGQVNQRVGTLSGGQVRRLDLAVGILGRPKVLFLDEPTTGFDPAARRQSWHLIEQLCRGGTTVLLTTHYLDEAEHLADRLGVLSHGRMVVEGTPSELLAMSPATVVSFDLPAGVEVGELPLPADFDMFGPRVVFETTTPTAVLTPILDEAAIRGVELDGLDVRKPSLEEVFLALEGE